MKKLLIALLALMVLMVSGCPTDLLTGDIFDTLLQDAEFLPNSGGQIGPYEPFERTDGLYGMLLIDTVERSNYAFTSGTYYEVDMYFTSPASIGADSYTLEFSDDITQPFSPYQYYGDDLVTSSSDQDNFSIAPGGSYYFRLAINGGPYNGWHSNVAYAPYTAIETYWSAWNLDASMSNSDPPVMVPFVGNTRVISMTAKKLEDNAEVSFTPTYQWYRLNPATYQMTEIVGATETTYTTTNADVGYLLVVSGTGDEVNVGGFQQVQDIYETKIPNKSYAVDVDLDGFYLVLEHEVVGLTEDDFVLYEYDWTTEIPITNVSPVDGNPGIYRVDATIPSGEEEVYLVNTSDFWTLTSYVSEDHPWAENLTIVL